MAVVVSLAEFSTHLK